MSDSTSSDSATWRAHPVRLLAVGILLLTLGLLLSTRPALASGSYNNAAIADKALSYWSGSNATGRRASGAGACQDARKPNDSGGECRAFVNCIVWMVSGHTQNLGGTDYFQPFLAAGGVEIRDANALAKGDIVQVGQGAHTFIVVSKVSAGQYMVVDSNHWRDWTVGYYQRAVSLSSTTRAFRMGAGGAVGSGASTDLYFAKTRNTGSGRVEAFTATAASGYQGGISSATRFSPGDANNGWFGLLPSTDLYFVKTKNVGSGRVEVHTATAGSGYQGGTSSATRFSPGDANNGWFGLLPNTDLYFVKTKNVGSGRVELHTATRASGYQNGTSLVVPRFSPGDASNGWFGLLPNGDVYFVKTRNTGSGRVEAFTATAASGYQTGISSATRFSPGDASNGWFRMLPNNDVYFVKTRNTGSGRVEVHTATRASGYQSGISSAAPRFSPSDASNGWFGLLG